MKILCFIDSLGSGGAQRQMVELAKSFKEKDHEVHFLTYHDINFFKPELDAVNIPVKTIVEPNYLKRIVKISKAIRTEKPDAVLSFLEGANFMATLAGFPKRKWKLVVGERSANPAVLQQKKLRFYRKAHFFADYIVGNSQKNIDLVKRLIPKIKNSKLKVIYNSVAIPKLDSLKSPSNIKTVVVIAASYRPVKNLDGLIEAVQMLPGEYRDKLRIDWYGNISMNPAYFQEKYEKIKHLNLQDILILNEQTNEIEKKYETADFIGLFSHYEGFPNTICEAMAMAKPVIVSRVSDVPLFIKENENGFLCESKFPQSIKDAFINAVDSTAEQRKIMGQRNYEIAKLRFDKEKIVEQYLRLLGNGE